MRIFISYRRVDSAADAGRIYDTLAAHFDQASVFMDVASILPGVSFFDVITQAIATSDVVLVLIGPDWLTSAAADGGRRIDDPSDFIRLEIEFAFRAKVPLIPVLLHGAVMPRHDDLPPSIAELSRLNAVMVRADPYYQRDIRFLISAVDSIAASVPSAAVTPTTVQDASQDLAPDPGRQAELEKAYTENVSQGHAPYQDVELASRGEVRWILSVRSWSGEPGGSVRQRANLSGARFLAPNLSGMHLYGANLSGASLEGCNLVDVVLAEAILDNANMRGARLIHADLHQARLTEANLEAADFEGADLSAASLKAARLTSVNLSDATLLGAALDGVDLSTAKLSGIVLEGADLREADLHDVTLDNGKLRGAQLIGANLAGAFLKGADLRGAVLERAHLESADVSGALMDKANLMGATLEGANFGGASLVGARLDSVAVLSSVVLDPRTKLDHVAWGGVSAREQGPAKNRAGRIAHYREDARQSRRLAIALRGQGLLAMASTYRLSEQQMERRALLWEGSIGAWFFSWLLDAVAGYGERPDRAFRTYLLVVASFAAAYFAITNAAIPSLASGSQRLQWYEAVVLSLSSFHGRGFFPQTLSLGDPVAIVAACEAVIGLFIELVFIATFSRRFLGN